MVKVLSQKVSDPRPRINATLESDDGRTTAEVARGYVNVQRGVKTAILRMPYGELANLVDLMMAAKDMLEKNGYNTNELQPLEMTEQADGVGKHAADDVNVPDDASSIHNPFAHQN